MLLFSPPSLTNFLTTAYHCQITSWLLVMTYRKFLWVNWLLLVHWWFLLKRWRWQISYQVCDCNFFWCCWAASVPMAVLCRVTRSCLTLCYLMDCSLPHTSVHNSPGENTGVSFHALFQRIFPTQASNPDLPHYRQILYCPSHQGSPSAQKADLYTPLKKK